MHVTSISVAMFTVPDFGVCLWILMSNFCVFFTYIPHTQCWSTPSSSCTHFSWPYTVFESLQATASAWCSSSNWQQSLHCASAINVKIANCTHVFGFFKLVNQVHILLWLSSSISALPMLTPQWHSSFCLVVACYLRFACLCSSVKHSHLSQL